MTTSYDKICCSTANFLHVTGLFQEILEDVKKKSSKSTYILYNYNDENAINEDGAIMMILLIAGIPSALMRGANRPLLTKLFTRLRFFKL